MLTISLREFRLKASEYLGSLPLVLTVNGKPKYKVIYCDALLEPKIDKSVNTVNTETPPDRTSVNTQDEESVNTSENESEKVLTHPSEIPVNTQEGVIDIPVEPITGIPSVTYGSKCQIFQCHRQAIGKFHVPQYTDQGEKLRKMFLCKVHFSKAKVEGIELKEL